MNPKLLLFIEQKAKATRDHDERIESNNNDDKISVDE
jgi:hypothetical protein